MRDDYLSKLATKAQELHGRVNALCAAKRLAPEDQHEFELEMARQSLAAVTFWLSEVEKMQSGGQA